MNGRAWVAALLLVVLGSAVYAPLRDAGFLWDDNVWLWDSPVSVAPDGPVRAFVAADRFDYFPVTSTAFWLAWRAFERNAVGYHVVNLLLHALASLLLWRVLRRLRLPGAWVAAALFAVHPVAVASVAWIAELKNTLCLVFVLASVLFWLRSEAGERAGYALSLAAFVVALLAKASAVFVPVWLLALAWMERGRIDRRDLLRVAPYVLPSLVAAVVTGRLQVARVIGSESLASEPLLAQVSLAARALGFYLLKTVWPGGLAILYPRWDTPSGVVLWVPLGVLLLVIAGLVALARRGYRRPAGVAVMWAAALAPTLGFVPMAYTLYSRVADHWAYFALPVGAAALVGGLAVLLARTGGGRRAAPALALIVVLLAGVLANRQAAAYRSTEALWQHVLRHDPASWAAHQQLAIQRSRAGEPAEAERLFLEAIRLRPGYALAHRNLAHHYELVSREDDAVAQYEAALEANPRYAEARLALGNLLLRRGATAEGCRHLEKVVEQVPSSFDAWFYLGSARAWLSDPDGAHAALERAIALRPEHFEARYTLAKIFFQMGEVDLAIAELENVLVLDPDHAEAAQVLQAMRQQQAGDAP